jgi:Uma2 family endonuclease
MATVSLMDEIHRMTVDEYALAAEANQWERTELIDGVVYDVSPQHLLHARTALRIYEALKLLLVDDIVSVGVTVRLGDYTAVDPDVLVIDGSVPVDDRQYIPAELVKLVVEVSVSTQAKDLGRKQQVYAAAGVAQYWVVDPRPEAGYLLRHTRPMGDAYGDVRRYAVGEGAEALDAAAVFAGR